MLTVYRWFVAVTGIANLAGGPVIVALHSSPTFSALGSVACLYVLAGFLSFSGVALIWASFAPAERAILIFWEGVLRLWAAGTFFTVSNWPQAHDVTLGDGSIGLIYIIGLFAVAKVPLPLALTGRR